MNAHEFSDIWVYLTASPLFGLTATLLAYCLARKIHQMSGNHPLFNPVIFAALVLITTLKLTAIPYKDYFAGAQFVHFLLGPATVALAIPLYRQWHKLKQLGLPIMFSLTLGVGVGGMSAVGIAWALGADTATLLSLAPKSVTTPVAMGIAEQLGGIPSLTAALVVVTGITGAVFGTHLLAWLGIRNPSVQGIALGVAAHGIGTARAFQVNAEMGAFAGLAMALSALVAALLLPWLVGWLI